MSTDAQKRASANYNRRQDNIMVRPSKEEGAAIRSAAASAGLSVQRFILEAVRERMEREASGVQSVDTPVSQEGIERGSSGFPSGEPENILNSRFITQSGLDSESPALPEGTLVLVPRGRIVIDQWTVKDMYTEPATERDYYVEPTTTDEEWDAALQAKERDEADPDSLPF